MKFSDSTENMTAQACTADHISNVVERRSRSAEGAWVKARTQSQDEASQLPHYLHATVPSAPQHVNFSHNLPPTLQSTYQSATMFKKECVALTIQRDLLANPPSITSGAKSKVKSSAQRAIRSKVLEEYPKLEPYIEDILPKKEQLDLVKLYVRLYTCHLCLYIPYLLPSHPTIHC